MDLPADPGLYLVVKGGESKEDVFPIALLRGCPTSPAAWSGEFARIEYATATAALIATSVRRATVRACALDEAVRQIAPAAWAVDHRHCCLAQISALLKSIEDILHNPGVVRGAGRRVQVERYPQTVPAIKKLVVVAIRYLFWCHTFLFRSDHDRGSVLIAPRYHQHFVPGESMVAGKDVGRQVAAGDVSKVKGAIGVGPGYANENTLCHS